MDTDPRSHRLSAQERLTFAALLAAIGLFVVTCTSCVPTMHAVFGGPESTRSATEQHAAIARIAVSCTTGDPSEPLAEHGGTGVVVSSDQIITALHVASCSDSKGVRSGELVTMVADAGDGVLRVAVVEVVVPGVDLARIRVIGKSLGDPVTPISIGPPPKIGERACEASGIPRMTYRCGTVEEVTETAIEVDMFTEFGNSGSGVYVDGKLVGIVHATQYCQNDHTCVGVVTPLQNYKYLLPEQN